MCKRTFDVRFAVEEHPDTEQEVVTVKSGVIDETNPRERAVVEAADASPYTHVETLALQEVDENE